MKTKQSSAALKLSLVDWLPEFFSKYEACRPSFQGTTPTKSTQSCLNSNELADWFTSLAQPLEDARSGAFQCDPWEIAGLGHDEVRNSKVLAWLLNPRGSHGLGDFALNGLLPALKKHFLGQFPNSAGRFCNIRTEVNPNGEKSDRVDIEVDSHDFYLLIEVKIKALEGKEQLDRYGDVAQKKAGQRPWALVFLTSDGRKPITASRHAEKTLPLSWRSLARGIEKSLADELSRDNQEKGAARIMAEQIIYRFLQRIRTF